MEWKHYKMDDVIDEISMGPFGSDVKKEFYVNKGIPILNGSNLQGFKLQENSFGYLTEEKADSLNKCNAHRGDIIVTHRGTLGQIVYVPSDSKYDRYVISQSQFRFRCKPDLVDVQYLVYYFHTREGQYKILANASQVGVPALARATSTFRLIDIKLPSLADQRRIASILSSLDRKIELNNKINADLEEMAQAIFKNWFVDFEPFKDGKFVDSELGMIPEGWKVGTLGEFCKCLLGGTPSRSKEEYWNGEVNWINSGEINKFRILEASEKITELGLAKSATKLLPKKTTVLAITGATLGQVSLLEIDTCANQSVIGVLENTEVPYEYIYPFIKDRIEMLIQHQTGGAQQHINKDNVESLIFLLPTINVLEDYISLVSPMYKRIESQCFENLYLSLLRDTLLPRLMSGELEVPE